MMDAATINVVVMKEEGIWLFWLWYSQPAYLCLCLCRFGSIAAACK